jgi:hypothetical protein
MRTCTICTSSFKCASTNGAPMPTICSGALKETKKSAKLNLNLSNDAEGIVYLYTSIFLQIAPSPFTSLTISVSLTISIPSPSLSPHHLYPLTISIPSNISISRLLQNGEMHRTVWCVSPIEIKTA